MNSTKRIIGSVTIALLIVLAGCSALSGVSESVTEAATQTPTTPESIPEATATPTPGPTPEAMATESEAVTTDSLETDAESPAGEELSKAEKFRVFDDHVKYTSERGGDDNPRLVETDAFPENDSYQITLEMRDTSNFTKSRNDRLHPLFVYLAIVRGYNEDGEYADRDHTYIPDTINVTFVTEDGGVYQTSYMKYTWAWKHSTGDWSFRVLIGMYASSIEDGPAHTDNES